MKLILESWRKFVAESEEDFEPHMMYDPKTGKSEKAETYERHLELDKKGWVHEKPEETIDEDAIGMAQDLAGSGELGADKVYAYPLPKASGRAIKDAFRKNADHQWLATLSTVHWAYDTSGIRDVINSSKDELSAVMNLPGERFVQAGEYPLGILVKGRITLATNEQDKLYSGGYHDYVGSDNEEEAAKQVHRRKSSGVNKRPMVSKDFSRYGKLQRGNKHMEKMAISAIPYVLDQETWNPEETKTNNEALVDNWKPIAFVVAPADIIRAVKAVAQDRTQEAGETKNLFALAEKYSLPILDQDQNVLWEPGK